MLDNLLYNRFMWHASNINDISVVLKGDEVKRDERNQMTRAWGLEVSGRRECAEKRCGNKDPFPTAVTRRTLP